MRAGVVVRADLGVDQRQRDRGKAGLDLRRLGRGGERIRGVPPRLRVVTQPQARQRGVVERLGSHRGRQDVLVAAQRRLVVRERAVIVAHLSVDTSEIDDLGGGLVAITDTGKQLRKRLLAPNDELEVERVLRRVERQPQRLALAGVPAEGGGDLAGAPPGPGRVRGLLEVVLRPTPVVENARDADGFGRDVDALLVDVREHVEPLFLAAQLGETQHVLPRRDRQQLAAVGADVPRERLEIGTFRRVAISPRRVALPVDEQLVRDLPRIEVPVLDELGERVRVRLLRGREHLRSHGAQRRRRLVVGTQRRGPRRRHDPKQEQDRAASPRSHCFPTPPARPYCCFWMNFEDMLGGSTNVPASTGACRTSCARRASGRSDRVGLRPPVEDAQRRAFRVGVRHVATDDERADVLSGGAHDPHHEAVPVRTVAPHGRAAALDPHHAVGPARLLRRVNFDDVAALGHIDVLDTTHIGIMHLLRLDLDLVGTGHRSLLLQVAKVDEAGHLAPPTHGVSRPE